MNVHFCIVGNPGRPTINMMKLLLYSLRQNGGALATAPVTVVTNAVEMGPDAQQSLRDLGATTFRTMPRQPGSLYDDKFNALYAVQQPYDVLVYLDTDVVVLNALDPLVEGIDPEQAVFRARRVGSVGARAAGDYASLIEEFSLSADQTLSMAADDRFPNGYPLFNGGVMVLTQPAVKQMRADALEISYSLYARRAQESLRSLQGMGKEAVRRLWRRLLPGPGPENLYEPWMTEQLGVALSILKHDISYGLLPPRCNWVDDSLPEPGSPPALYHYMKGRHEIDRGCLFSGSWIETYETSDSPMRAALARLTREYAAAR